MDYKSIVFSSLKKNIKKYMVFLVSGIISTALYFLYTTLVYNSGTMISEKGSIFGTILRSSISIIIVMLSYFTIYSYSSYISLRLRDFGIMLRIGMTKRELSVCITLENVFISAMFLLVGLCLGSVFSKIFFLAVLNYLGLSGLSFSLGVMNYIATLMFYIIIFIIITIRTGRILSEINTSANAKSRGKLRRLVLKVFKHIIFIALVFSEVMIKIYFVQGHIKSVMYIWIGCMILIYGSVFYISSLCVYILKKRNSLYGGNFLRIKQLIRNIQKDKNFLFTLAFISFLFLSYNWICEESVYNYLTRGLTEGSMRMFRVIAFFTNILFFTISSSISYFKCQMELESNTRYFKKLYLIGLTKEEYNSLIKYKLLSIFFTPYTLCFITSILFIIGAGADIRMVKFIGSILILSYLFHMNGYSKVKKLYMNANLW